MPTDIRKYVDVVVSRATRPIDTANFSVPLFITQTNLFDANERIRTYSSVEAMTSDGWSATSAAVRFATNVFAGTFRPRTVQIGKQSFERYEVTVVPGSVTYSLTIGATGIANQVVTFTGTELSSQADVAAGLVAAIQGNSAFTGKLTASVVSDNVQIVPTNPNIVTLSGLTSNLQSNVNRFTIDVASGLVGAQPFTVDVFGSAGTFTSDATPTASEVTTGLVSAINALSPSPEVTAFDNTNSAVSPFGFTADIVIRSSDFANSADRHEQLTSSSNITASTSNLSVSFQSGLHVRFSSVGADTVTFTLSATGVTDKQFTGTPEQIRDDIQADSDYNGVVTTSLQNTNRDLYIIPENGVTVSASAISQIGTDFVALYDGFFLVNLAPNQLTYSFDITANGQTETVTTSATIFETEANILAALEADLDSKTALASAFVSQVAGGELQIDPVDGQSVSITNVSNTLTSDFDHFVINSSQTGATYSFDLNASNVANAQTIQFTSDSTPTVSEILNGLSTQITQSGIFTNSFVVGVVGNALQITPNDNIDATFSNVSANLVVANINPETALDAVNAAAAEDDTFFFLAAEDKDVTTQLALGGYAQAEDKMYITAVPASTVATTDTDDPASQLMNANLDNTHSLTLPDTRLDEQVEGGIIGAIASANPGETILAYKTLNGVTNTGYSTTEQGRIQGKNSNIYPRVAGVSVYDSGVNASGLFFDDVRFGLWMKARVAEAIFGLLKRESDLGRKVVYGNQGFDQIRQAIFDNVLNVAIRRNAILTPQTGGADVNDPIVRIPDRSEIPDNDIANRTLRDVVVEFTFSGAIQTVMARVFILI